MSGKYDVNEKVNCKIARVHCMFSEETSLLDDQQKKELKFQQQKLSQQPALKFQHRHPVNPS